MYKNKIILYTGQYCSLITKLGLFTKSFSVKMKKKLHNFHNLVIINIKKESSSEHAYGTCKYLKNNNIIFLESLTALTSRKEEMDDG